MKSNDLKTRVRFPSTINKDNLDALRALSKQTSIPMSVLMDQGLELLFDRYAQSGQAPSGANNQQDDEKKEP